MNTNGETVIEQKTRELCEAILKDPEFVAMRRQIDTFMSDDKAKNQYQQVIEQGENLQQKQQMGQSLTNDEIARFEQDRDALVNNPVAKAFLDAQHEMHHVQESVGKYVAKTIELGRVPSKDEMASGCGSGCGCEH